MNNIIKKKLRDLWLYTGGEENERFQTKLDESNNYLIKLLNGGMSCFIGRLGRTEALATIAQIRQERFDPRYWPFPSQLKRSLSLNAGMFSNGFSGRHRFSKLLTSAIAAVDALIVWNPSFDEERSLVNRFARKNVMLLDWWASFPFLSTNPWTNALAGKSVLVINPNADLIEKQYRKKDMLFSAERRLPSFQLKTYAPIITNGTGSYKEKYGSWFECLHRMLNDIIPLDFDIALVGCGSYGMPLCHQIFLSGRTAIYLGGDSSDVWNYGKKVFL